MVHSQTISKKRIDNLEIVDILGEGAYGKVYLAKQVDTGRLYAVKSLRQASLDSRQRAFQRTEIGLHARLSGHPHIIGLERVIREPEWTHMVLEYGPEGDLFTAITERDLYVGHHELIRHVFLQLLDAVSYCHSNGVYHRDLKPENVLVFDQGRTVKLADFGLASTDPISTDYGCGSTFYFSPGKLLNRPVAPLLFIKLDLGRMSRGSGQKAKPSRLCSGAERCVVTGRDSDQLVSRAQPVAAGVPERRHVLRVPG